VFFSAGNSGGVLITQAGKVLAMGENRSGVVGNGTTTQSANPGFFGRMFGGG
jgi:alpha-tubulin suppressor-like RCC1 family protein